MSHSSAARRAPGDGARTASRDRPARLASPGARAVIAVSAVAVVVALRASGVLTGLPALVLAVGLLLLLPTATTLSGRVLLTGLSALGLTQMLWWWAVPVDRVTVALALVAGAVGFLAPTRTPGGRSYRLVPGLRPVDAVPWVTAAAGLLAFAPALTRVDRTAALALLLPGWDNSAHFNMFRMVLTHGRTLDTVPRPAPGESWLYFDYPQGFQATAATVTQLMWPHAANDVGSTLVAYNRSTALVVVAAVAVVVAGIAALPNLRSRLDVVVVLAALVGGAFFLGAGMVSVRSGFASFVLPCALIGGALFVTATMDRVVDLARLTALGAAAVGVAHGWMLLLAVMLPVVLGAALPLRAARWRASPVRWALATGIVLVTGYGVVRAAAMVLSNATGTTLTVPGGITPPPVGLLVALAVVALGVCLLPPPRTSPGSAPGLDRDPMTRVLLGAMLVPVAAVVATWVAVAQVEANGSVGYYLWKLLTGVELVTVALVAVGVGVRVRAGSPRLGVRPGDRLRRLASTGAIAVGVTQVFGYTGPSRPALAISSTDPVSAFHATHRSQVAAAAPVAGQLLQAATVLPPAERGSALLLDPAAMNPITAQQWYMALRGTWTVRANKESLQLVPRATDTAPTVDVAARWLAGHPGEVVTTPELHDVLEASGDPRIDTRRLTTW